MFRSKQKKFEKAMGRFLTGSEILKAAVANDKQAMTALVTGQTADDEGLWYALQTFILIAHQYPEVIGRLREIQSSMPPKAEIAFTSGIAAAEKGDARLFRGGDVVGQGLFIAYLAGAIAEDPGALTDAMMALGDNA